MGNIGFLLPKFLRLQIFAKHGYPKSRLIESNDLGKKFPSKTNRVFFEVITKAEVSQHLKKGVMSKRTPNIL